MEDDIAQNRIRFFRKARPLGSKDTASAQMESAIPLTSSPRTSWMGIPVRRRNASGLGQLAVRNGADGTTSPAATPKATKKTPPDTRARQEGWPPPSASVREAARKKSDAVQKMAGAPMKRRTAESRPPGAVSPTPSTTPRTGR